MLFLCLTINYGNDAYYLYMQRKIKMSEEDRDFVRKLKVIGQVCPNTVPRAKAKMRPRKLLMDNECALATVNEIRMCRLWVDEYPIDKVIGQHCPRIQRQRKKKYPPSSAASSSLNENVMLEYLKDYMTMYVRYLRLFVLKFIYVIRL